jgi:hypothetical protein
MLTSIFQLIGLELRHRIARAIADIRLSGVRIRLCFPREGGAYWILHPQVLSSQRRRTDFGVLAVGCSGFGTSAQMYVGCF